MAEMNYMNRKDSLKTIISLKSGKVSELEELLGKERVRDFETIGYIINGISSSGETWRLGPSVEKMYNSLYGEITLNERFYNLFFNSIFKF